MAATNPSASALSHLSTSVSASTLSAEGFGSPDTKEGIIPIKEEPHDPATSGALSPTVIKKEEGDITIKKEEDEEADGKESKPRGTGETEVIKELRIQLK